MIPYRLKKKVMKMNRRKHHPLLHHIHKRHCISHKTLFYMKEYGPKSHIASVIVKESLKIIILASILSSIGGIGLQSIRERILTILPLLILLPALNDMIGDYGTIISSKFTTGLYTGRIKSLKSKEIHNLFTVIASIAIISSIYIGILSCTIAYFNGYSIAFPIIIKVLWVSILTTIALVMIIFFVSITTGLWIYSKREDPNNFLIPITTSVGDLGSMLIFSTMILLFF